MASHDDLPRDLVGRLSEHDPPAGTLIGDFRVEGKLGEGGMGSVYAAVHPVLGKRAAIKVISRRLCADLHAVERFVQEARAVHQIGHPNIVDSFAFGTLPDGRAYYMMEWLQGETLAARLSRGRLPLPLALDVLVQLTDAIEAAHDKGVIHRDLKPDNVFVVETRDRPFVKVLDFGLSKLADADVTLPRSRSRSGVGVGTAGYMSPEQARGKNVDGSTDVYALGAIAFEIILGRLPFQGESAIDILAQHLAEPVPSPGAVWRRIPRALDRLLVAMLDKEAPRRPPLAEVRRVLSELRNGGPLPEMGEAPAKHWWTIGVTATAALSLVVGVALLRHPAPQAPVAPVTIAQPQPPPPAARQVVPAAPTTGRLVLHTSPGAAVKLDGQPVDPARPIEVARGSHELALSAPHHRAQLRTVEVSAGQTVELNVKLVRDKPAATQHGDYMLDPFE
jgi:serine/threonine-protein kinase